MIRALLVDLDGTLVDTHAANLAAYRQVLEETGLPYSDEKLVAAVGRLAWRPMLQQVLPGHPEAHQAVAERKRRHYPGMMKMVRVNDRLVAMIKLLRGQLSVGLVTSASRESVAAVLKEKELAGLFDVVITSDDVKHPKPEPDAYRMAAARLGVAPAECVVLEDSPVGLAAAQAFGAQVWQVHW